MLIYDSLARPGVEDNLGWLKRRHPAADFRDRRRHPRRAAVEEAASRASAVFHLAAQVAVTTSLDDPREDFEVNVRGTLLLLDALRRRPTAVPMIFASTNKVYGDLADVALVRRRRRAIVPRDAQLARARHRRDRALELPHPYGCSKGAADQYVLDYARSFGLPTAVLRMSCIYGPRQFGTEDQGWVAHFLLRAHARASRSPFMATAGRSATSCASMTRSPPISPLGGGSGR